MLNAYNPGFYTTYTAAVNPLEYLLSARGTVFGALCAYGFFVRSASVSDFVVWDGGLPFSDLAS
jgi:hypothetical protein